MPKKLTKAKGEWQVAYPCGFLHLRPIPLLLRDERWGLSLAVFQFPISISSWSLAGRGLIPQNGVGVGVYF
jgi:hypothetical protein